MNESASEAQLRHELESIKNYLVAAQDVAKSGHMPQLTGLENRIAALCEVIQKAEPDIQKICLPELQILLEQLDACEKAMSELHASRTVEEKKS